MNLRLLPRLLLAAGLAAMLSACVNLKPVADPTRFYVLSVEPAKEALAGTGKLPVPVCVAAVEVPAYLDNPCLAIQRQGNELEYAEFHRWAEPVRDGLARCLREHLAGWLGTGGVPPLSRRRPGGESLEVQASVSRFTVTPAGQTELAVRWRIVQSRTGVVLHAQRTEVKRQASHAAEDWDAEVGELSQAVASWSREVAEALGAHGAEARPRP